MIIKLIFLMIWMIWIPICMAMIPVTLWTKGRAHITLSFLLPAGTLLFWAVMQLTTVPFILLSQSFKLQEHLLDGILLLLMVIGMWMMWKSRADWKAHVDNLLLSVRETPILVIVVWCVFAASVLFQMYQAYTLAYADGDDSYYIPIATIADLGGKMYTVDPYTGQASLLDLRYGLAPFPIWIAYLADKCHVNAAVAAHSLIPLVLIPVTYLIYLEIGKRLCGEKKKLLPVFMLFVSLLQIFGNYSIYPASTFFLTRTRQGKAALGNVILPFAVLLMFLLAEYAAEKKREKKDAGWLIFWLMVLATAACLCSTMSTFLVMMAVMLASCLLAAAYRKWYLPVIGFAGCIPCMAYALLYFIG